jgi:predicted GTPase
MTFDNLETLNVDFDNMKYFEDFAFSNSSTNNSIKSILREPLLSKNINCVDDVLKFIFIGDQGVGKSFLINKLLDDKAVKEVYNHTKSLEIKKKNINLLGKRLTLELWDTNLEILNNDLSKGIIFNNFSLYKYV